MPDGITEMGTAHPVSLGVEDGGILSTAASARTPSFDQQRVTVGQRLNKRRAAGTGE
ncbi:hypothetical protein GCM10009539_73760 [Cryptosporangium japonicum]|uniref:Transposase n=1 Tax=Cryptosporangium japonicum TaxID=80872 RepID=A0ABN0V5W8_9ACTN